MGRFDAAMAAINANIKKNGNQEITGSILKSVLIQMIEPCDDLYLADFTIEGLDGVYRKGQGSVPCDASSLVRAIRDGKRIIVPVIEGVPGYALCSAYEEDLVYITIFGDPLFKIEIGHMDKEIAAENIVAGTYLSEIVKRQEIATINGQLLTEGGNIVIKGGGGEPYVTDFTINDLYELVYRDAPPVQANIVALQRALENKERIVVPYGTEEFKGYSLLQGYYEDLVYFTVTDENGSTYIVEVDQDAGEIDRDNITHVSPKENKINIADLQAKDTQIEVKLTELSADVSGLSERVDKLGQPIFKAVYGETKIEDVIAAYESGIVVHCDYNNYCYVLSRLLGGEAYFSAVDGQTSSRLFCSKNSNWSVRSFTAEQTSNKTTTINESSTDTQYPSAKAVYDALQNVGEKDYELLLDATMQTDVETFSVIDRVPNILSYKDYIILLEFKYQEGVTRGKGYLSFDASASTVDAVVIEKVVTTSYLTHYILRIHRGSLYDNTAYLESHTNDFSNAAYADNKQGLNLFAAKGKGSNMNTCVFNFKFYAGEKITIYGK